MLPALQPGLKMHWTCRAHAPLRFARHTLISDSFSYTAAPAEHLDQAGPLRAPFMFQQGCCWHPGGGGQAHSEPVRERAAAADPLRRERWAAAPGGCCTERAWSSAAGAGRACARAAGWRPGCPFGARKRHCAAQRGAAACKQVCMLARRIPILAVHVPGLSAHTARKYLHVHTGSWPADSAA